MDEIVASAVLEFDQFLYLLRLFVFFFSFRIVVPTAVVRKHI